MPVPRRRHSRARQAKRRTHYKLPAPGMVPCEKCGEPKRAHRICPNCGTYKQKEMAPPRPNTPEV